MSPEDAPVNSNINRDGTLGYFLMLCKRVPYQAADFSVGANCNPFLGRLLSSGIYERLLPEKLRLTPALSP